MVEGPKPSEISTIEQINEETLKEFLTQSVQYGTFMTLLHEDYMTKSDHEKKLLVINVYNYISSGINLFFLLFVIFLFGILSEMSGFWAASSSMIRSSPVVGITLTLLSSSNLSGNFDSMSE